MHSKKNGTLTIIESETGSGKTEAAVDYFFQLREKGVVDRLYFALPSRTSAAQIHKRVKDSVAKYFGKKTPVILAVPGYLSKEQSWIGGGEGLGDSGEEDIEEWFSSTSKRYLSAPVAVGTIDQVLLSVLSTKHQTLRWASLGRSLIVVDEVHASDAYMGQLLKTIVKRHSQRGGHCLIMSATLGSSLADNLLAQTGYMADISDDLEDYMKRPYPAVHHYDGTKYTNVAIPTTGEQKNVKLSIANIIDRPEEIAKLAKEHYLKGAKVLVIRNSVKGCLDVHEILENDNEVGTKGLMNTKEGVAAPHHGRYASVDRFKLDIAVEDAFGIKSTNKAVILCSTQTVEQSLDIDADIIITDICPIDVLLQRIGRLHRHEGKAWRTSTRPVEYQQAEAIVLSPADCVTKYALKADHGIGKNRAYEDIRIIYLTLKLVKEKQCFNIPADNRYLVEYATNEISFHQINPDNEYLNKHSRDYIGKIYAERTIANENIASYEWEYGDYPQNDDDNTYISSRLGVNDALVTLKNPFISAHGGLINDVKIPSWVFKKENPVDAVVDNSYGLNETFFEVSGVKLHYGHCGLGVVD